MGISVAVVQAAARTSTGTQDFTKAGLGTPKAAIFILSQATVNGTPANNVVLSWGFTDGTRHRVANASAQHGVGTSNTFNRVMDDQVIAAITPADGSVDGEAAFSAWITNGVRINWAANAPGSAWLITCILFAGTDLSVYVSDVNMDGAENSTVDVTDPGFEPDQVFAMFQGFRAWSDDTARNSNLVATIGVVDNGVAVVQGSVGWLARNAQATERAAAVASELYGVRIVDVGAVAGEFGDFDANGFSVTKRTGSGTFQMAYLALNYGGVKSHWVGPVTSPTSTGNASVAGVGFIPDVVVQLEGLCRAYDTAETDDDANALGIGVFTSSDEYSAGWAIDDGAATMDNESIADAKAAHLRLGDGNAAHVASFVSMDADGYTLNYSTANGTARKWIALAIGAAAGDPEGSLIGGKLIRGGLLKRGRLVG